MMVAIKIEPTLCNRTPNTELGFLFNIEPLSPFLAAPTVPTLGANLFTTSRLGLVLSQPSAWMKSHHLPLRRIEVCSGHQPTGP